MGTPQITARQRRIGFTLVELLVVIGIIALLISILLPSLARARASAVSLDCQARLRTIGQSMFMYGAQYKGMLPMAVNPSMDDTVNPPVARNKTAVGLLSETLGTETWNVNPIFHDKDTIDPEQGAGSFVGDNPYARRVGPYTSHYTPNSRLIPMPASVAGDRYNGTPVGLTFAEAGTKQTAPRNLASIKNSAECAAWWDSSQIRQFAGTGSRRMYAAYPYSDGTGEWAWHGAAGGRFVNYQNVLNGYDASAMVISFNQDADALGTGQSQGGIRFRHMKNTVANILYADGHVGSHMFNVATGKTSMPLRELGANFVPPK
jgi:prepilin-type processing-associated H-X9-DG protein/prepilin-type N-terminal cleavage/methylation domain-containing protein